MNETDFNRHMDPKSISNQYQSICTNSDYEKFTTAQKPKIGSFVKKIKREPPLR
jgi:hypothetical protein